jgi:NADPH:quinone reductase-like Zn-dependent oxidoreductase
MVKMPVPEAAEGEVLIKVEAAGVNRPDVIQRQGRQAMLRWHFGPLLLASLLGRVVSCTQRPFLVARIRGCRHGSSFKERCVVGG